MKKYFVVLVGTFAIQSSMAHAQLKPRSGDSEPTPQVECLTEKIFLSDNSGFPSSVNAPADSPEGKYLIALCLLPSKDRCKSLKELNIRLKRVLTVRVGSSIYYRDSVQCGN